MENRDEVQVNVSTIARQAGASELRPRRFWQVTVFLFVLMFLVSGAMTLVSGAPSAGSMAMGAIDLMGLMALAGYGWRRPLPHAGLQILVFLLAAFYFLRVALIAIVVWPNLLPWRGDAVAWEALGIYAMLPFLALIGLGLYRYATDRTHVREAAPPA